jgi:hypothetical protein
MGGGDADDDYDDDDDDGGNGEGGILLGRWLENQRASHSKGRLMPERYEKLKSLGVDFHDGATSPSSSSSPQASTSPKTPSAIARKGVLSPALKERWECQLREYVKYCGGEEYYGTTMSATLEKWAENQRVARRAGRLSDERIELLERYEFDFGKSKDERWEMNLYDLARYKRRHGDCEVPRKYGPCPTLGRWVRKQRFELHHGRLSDERYVRLCALGFWGPGEGRGGGGARRGRGGSPSRFDDRLRPTSLFPAFAW